MKLNMRGKGFGNSDVIADDRFRGRQVGMGWARPKRAAGDSPSESQKPIVKSKKQSGFTLLEIIIVITILSILTAAAIPMVRNSVKRQREEDLRVALRQLRQAIDKYKEFYDRTNGGAIPLEYKTQSGYPKDMKMLVEGFIPANVVGTSAAKMRFLR